MGIKLKNKEKIKAWKRVRRVARVRARLSGTAARPRLAVFRSLKIVDAAGKTFPGPAGWVSGECLDNATELKEPAP